MRRREFIACIGGTAVAWPFVAFGQQSSGKVWRVAYLYPGALNNPPDHALFDVFRMEMRELGYIEGKNLIIDFREAGGKFERLPSLVSELIALRPDVIVAILNATVAAAQKATSTIPIIMAPTMNPIGVGFVKSLAKPGGNVTGISSMTDDIMGKAAEVLHTILPSAHRVAVLTSNNPTHSFQYQLAEDAFEKLGVATVRVAAPTSDDLEQAFETMKKENCDALFLLGDLTRPTIVTLAARSKMPTIYSSSAYVPLGGLASYSPQLAEIYRVAAQYCDRIFKGANPAELPVEQPVIFELAVNLKTAASLGITIPDSILARADKVIE
jgi:putative ABC transport system substrate-binding protein